MRPIQDPYPDPHQADTDPLYCFMVKIQDMYIMLDCIILIQFLTCNIDIWLFLVIHGWMSLTCSKTFLILTNSDNELLHMYNLVRSLKIKTIRTGSLYRKNLCIYHNGKTYLYSMFGWLNLCNCSYWVWKLGSYYELCLRHNIPDSFYKLLTSHYAWFFLQTTDVTLGQLLTSP